MNNYAIIFLFLFIGTSLWFDTWFRRIDSSRGAICFTAN